MIAVNVALPEILSAMIVDTIRGSECACVLEPVAETFVIRLLQI